MSTHNIYFRGIIRKIPIVLVVKGPYLDLCHNITETDIHLHRT